MLFAVQKSSEPSHALQQQKYFEGCVIPTFSTSLLRLNCIVLLCQRGYDIHIGAAFQAGVLFCSIQGGREAQVCAAVSLPPVHGAYTPIFGHGPRCVDGSDGGEHSSG